MLTLGLWPWDRLKLPNPNPKVSKLSRSVRIVTICSGNICRSPMAEGMLKHKMNERELPAAIISAGTLGLVGHRASEHARAVMLKWGFSIDEHRSQKISVPLLRMADYLIVMAPRHERAILQLDPKLQPRIVRLWEFSQNPIAESEIPDPVGKNYEDFIINRDLIDECLENWLDSFD